MPKSEILTQILSDYKEAHPELVGVEGLEAFCVYAAGWFSANNVVGLGCTTDGMALRFGDGREMVFFVGAGSNVPPEAVSAFSITGNSGSGITRPALGDSPSFPITR